jgi:hypothetical protein
MAARFGAACVLLDLERVQAQRGLALIKRLRELPQSSKAFLIGVGPLGGVGASCFTLGFDHYLSLPLCERELEELLCALPDCEGVFSQGVGANTEFENIQKVQRGMKNGPGGIEDSDSPF